MLRNCLTTITTMCVSLMENGARALQPVLVVSADAVCVCALHALLWQRERSSGQKPSHGMCNHERERYNSSHGTCRPWHGNAYALHDIGKEKRQGYS